MVGYPTMSIRRECRFFLQMLSNTLDRGHSRMQDHEIVDRLKRGDEEAFRMVVERHQKLVLNCAYRFLRDRESAEDLTQEVFLEVFESIHSFRADSQLATWIYRIVVTKSLNQLKSQRRKKRFARLVSVFGTENLADRILSSDAARPDRELENQERRILLNRALDRLPESQRIAFTLSKVEGMSYEEIARVMHTSLPAVESLIHRAKGGLRKRLFRYYSERTG